MLSFIIIVLVIIYFVHLKRKAKQPLDLQGLNKINADETANILSRVRTEILSTPGFYMDIFETDAQKMVFTNYGIAFIDANDKVNMVAYGVMKSISEPKPLRLADGKASKDWNVFTIDTTFGATFDITYYNMTGGAVLGMLDNIRKTGYPLPEYTGLRRIQVEDDAAEEMIEESNNPIYEGN